jgi:uncharacterized protein (DUF1778 family)
MPEMIALPVKSYRMEARHESVSGFVVRAARAEADRVLARTDVTVMPAEQFDAVVASLDSPDPAAKLVQAAARSRTSLAG